ncbi:hypothetical protein NIES39_O06980 [Arthrospira platensis NIES-39]|nr:hypothetical protein NIES39_O06980 [Arthrospira platensis NIES-39]
MYQNLLTPRDNQKSASTTPVGQFPREYLPIPTPAIQPISLEMRISYAASSGPTQR